MDWFFRKLKTKIGYISAIITGLAVIGGSVVYAFKNRPVFMPELNAAIYGTKRYHDEDIKEKFDQHMIVEDLKMRVLAAEMSKQIAVEVEKIHHNGDRTKRQATADEDAVAANELALDKFGKTTVLPAMQ